MIKNTLDLTPVEGWGIITSTVAVTILCIMYAQNTSVSNFTILPLALFIHSVWLVLFLYVVFMIVSIDKAYNLKMFLIKRKEVDKYGKRKSNPKVL